MERIKSMWRISWQPAGVVFVDFGDWMLAEPTLPQQREVQAQTFLRADNRHTYDRGNIGYDMSFSRVLDFTDPAELRNFAMSHPIAIAQLRSATLMIEIEGGNSYELRNASIQSVVPVMTKNYVITGRLAINYRVVGGELIELN